MLKQADADDVSTATNAVLERIYDMVSKNASLKIELNYTISRKPKNRKPKTKRPRKSRPEDLATKNSAAENSATKDTATENSAAKNSATLKSAAENSAAEHSATEDPATKNNENAAAVNSATENSAAETSTAEKLGKPIEEVDIADKRISKIFEYDFRQFSADLLASDKCTRWLQDPFSFLDFEFGQTLHGQFADNPQYSVILSIQKIEEQDTHSRILRRLYCIVFSMFGEAEGYEDAKTIATALYGHYYPSQPQCQKKLQQLTARIRDSEVAGRRYRDLIGLFCTGAIFLLGDEVSNST